MKTQRDFWQERYILIADSHLQGGTEKTACFFRMLDALAARKPAGIIFLGDIFELWIALDGYEIPEQKCFADWCRRHSAELEIGFIEGNHEFFVSETHADAFSWITDTRHDLNRTVRLMHGDTVNRRDWKYLLLLVMFEPVGATAQPIVITQNEFMRRMKDMAAIQPGMAIYGELPDSYNLIVNTEHPLTQRIIADTESSCKEQLTPILDELNTVNAEITRLQEAKKDKKDEEIPVADKEALKSAEEKAKELRSKESDVLKTYADKNPLVRQLVDLALLSNNMLKGEALNNFIKRSVDIL